MSAPAVRRPAPGDAAAVEALVVEAAAADGVGPLSEDAVLRLRAHVLPAGPAPHPGETAHLVAASPVGAPGGAGGVVGYVQVHSPAGAPEATAELLVHPAHRRRGTGTALLRAAREAAGRPVRLWAHGDLPGARALAAAAGLERVRELWRMARPLTGPGAQPLPDAPLPAGTALRTFVPGRDERAWLALNAEAFATHPEQGRWTAADLRARAAERWFDPAGFLLAVAGDELVGFHWTKVEPGASTGEVYVLGVSPRAHGRGLGRALAVAGLRHLAQRVDEVELYVDGDNAAAVRLYAGLGFERAALDVQYRTPG